MDATSWIDLQESLLWFFGPIINTLMILLMAGGVLSAIGAIILDLAAKITR